MKEKFSKELISAAIAEAKRAEFSAKDRKGETYLGVLIAYLLGATGGVAHASVANMPRRSRPKKLSVGELFAEKIPRTDAEKVLTVGYFLEVVEGLDMFNVDDLDRCFDRMKIGVPVNVNDSVNKNIRKGKIEPASQKKKGKKAWLLTGTGESAVEAGFKGGSRS